MNHEHDASCEWHRVTRPIYICAEFGGYVEKIPGIRNNLTARRATDRTHCSRGHEFTDENTWRSPLGYQQCKTCQQNTKAAWYLRQKAKASA